MRIKVDENLPPEAARVLRDSGHDADSVVDEKLQGVPDAKLAAVCAVESRALLTLDSDFADIRTYPPSAFSGLIVMRLHRMDKEYVLSVLRRLLPVLKEQSPSRQLWIVQDGTIRIHE